MIIFIGIVCLFFLILWFKKIHIDYRSILSKTLPLDTGVFGVYCFDGKQGTGKTYALTKFIIKEAKGKKIYSNLTLHGVEYEKILSKEHLLSLRDEKNLFIIYDEIFTLLNDKTIPKNIRDDLTEFLSQQRKMKNILLTTAQEWLNIPIEFRRYVRILISCKTRPLGRLGGILIETYKDATNMKWENEEHEYLCPLIRYKVSKYERRFMESYDTYERIRQLS